MANTGEFRFEKVVEWLGWERSGSSVSEQYRII